MFFDINTLLFLLKKKKTKPSYLDGCTRIQ